MSTIAHAAERKVFEVALNAVVKKTERGRRNGYVGVVNAIEAVLGDGWKPEAYNALREAFGKEGKWTIYIELDSTVRKHSVAFDHNGHL